MQISVLIDSHRFPVLKKPQAHDNAVKDVKKAMKESGKPESKTMPELEILIEMLGGAIETAETLGVDEKLVPWVFGCFR